MDPTLNGTTRWIWAYYCLLAYYYQGSAKTVVILGDAIMKFTDN